MVIVVFGEINEPTNGKCYTNIDFFVLTALVNPIVAVIAQKGQKVVIIDGFDGSYVFESHLEEYG